MDRLNAMYSNTCTVCGGSKRHSLPSLRDAAFDDIIAKMAAELYNEKKNNGTIPEALYNKIAERLTNGMFEGLGDTAFAFDDNRNTLSAYLRHNIYAFSAAKSLTEMQHFNNLLIDEEGQLRSFVAFRNACFDAGYTFNVTHLEVEYDNAVASAEMAQKWHDLTANHDYLQYSTVGDDKVRKAHALLDKLTLHKSSPVWRRIWPPMDWKCRCTIIPGIESDVKYSDSEAGKLGKQAATNPLFDRNTGIEKIVFDDKHPTMEILGKKRMLTAEGNYGMPSVDKIYTDSNLPEIATAQKEEDYMAWWAAQKKLPNTDNIVIQDITGLSVLFDSYETTRVGKTTDYFKAHILRKEGEQRWKYAHEFSQIMQEPDEVWSQMQKGKPVIFYLKYYEDAPYVVVVSDHDNVMKAESMYRLDIESRIQTIRRGVLLYRK